MLSYSIESVSLKRCAYFASFLSSNKKEGNWKEDGHKIPVNIIDWDSKFFPALFLSLFFSVLTIEIGNKTYTIGKLYKCGIELACF